MVKIWNQRYVPWVLPVIVNDICRRIEMNWMMMKIKNLMSLMMILMMINFNKNVQNILIITCLKARERSFLGK